MPQLLSNFCKEINDRLSEATEAQLLDLVADAHYNFINIHPFADGNGRTARLLSNYLLAYHGFPPLKIFTEDRTVYIDALNATEAERDLGIFREFIRGQYRKYLSTEIRRVRGSDLGGFSLLF